MIFDPVDDDWYTEEDMCFFNDMDDFEVQSEISIWKHIGNQSTESSVKLDLKL